MNIKKTVFYSCEGKMRMSSKPLACCLLVSSERAREVVEHPVNVCLAMTKGEEGMEFTKVD